MKKEEILEKFCKDFPNQYKKIYEGLGYTSEPMPCLTKRGLDEVLSILSASFMRIEYEGKDVFWAASFISLHIASRQVLENGNKRLSLYALCYFLSLHNKYVCFEKDYYANMILNFVNSFSSCDATDREKFMENYIIAFAKDLETNSKESSNNESLFERIRRLIP